MGCCFASCCPGVVAYNLCLIKGHPHLPAVCCGAGFCGLCLGTSWMGYPYVLGCCIFCMYPRKKYPGA
jgi:hypothetical protein